MCVASRTTIKLKLKNLETQPKYYGSVSKLIAMIPATAEDTVTVSKSKPNCDIDRATLSKLRGRAQDIIQSLVPLRSMTISWESELMVCTPGFT